ncbi:MAG TPA: NAD(P)/FAD-dependent oxidoreductase [Chthoniobacteraceae bacterium]|jgi:NAD(P)H-nitrite reductase large subunit
MIRREYLIVGAGVAGASVCEGIREHDPKGSVMMIGNETCLPYFRPLLFQSCLNGKSPAVEKMQHRDAAWFEKKHIDLRLDTMVTQLNVERRLAVLSNGQAVEFKKACLATGSRARRPQVAGYNLGNIVYLRTVRDMLALREMMENEREIIIVGGGFLAAESAWLLANRPKVKITILHRGRHLWDRKLDPETAAWFTSHFEAHGIKLMLGEVINGFEGRTILKNIQTKSGQRFPAEMAIVAIGCEPNLALVQNTPLSYPQGTPVNDHLETDEKGIYAVGDIAAYPCRILGGVRRFEHSECAIAQGKVAGANMTGKKRIKFEHVPHSVGRAFDLHFDFIGDFSKPPTRVEFDGSREKKKFIARYYQPAGLMGILLCNQTPEKVAAATEELKEAPRGKKELTI